jgi:hypothetical protein
MTQATPTLGWPECKEAITIRIQMLVPFQIFIRVPRFA